MRVFIIRQCDGAML